MSIYEWVDKCLSRSIKPAGRKTGSSSNKPEVKVWGQKPCSKEAKLC